MATSDPIHSQFYTVGGTMRPDAPSYIVREADRELYERAMAGDFCYVLTPRQMGKSSLMAQTAKRLREKGMHTVILDLTQIGTERSADRSADAWYYGIAHRILRALRIRESLPAWWQERQGLPALQRLMEFLRDLVVAKTAERLVIFVDEVDTTIVLPFTDDFFAAIRACYNARATESAYERLSFVLLGVASPSQLIKDVRRTPFNIGNRIDLTDFTFDEARPLARGLGGDSATSEKVLQRILYWTGGHPYLTQKLCGVVVEEKIEASTDDAVDRLVEKYCLAPEVHREEHNLNFVRDRLTRDEEYGTSLLRRYYRIRQGKRVIDDPRSPVTAALKLSGVVVPREDRTLRVRNRIYEHVFTAAWARRILHRGWRRRLSVFALVLFILGVGVWYTHFLPHPHIQILRTASEDYALAYHAYKRLRSMPGHRGKAADLWAGFWERRAIHAEARGGRDEALLLRLRALAARPTMSRRREAGRLAGADYTCLLATYRYRGEFGAVAFSPDGQSVLTGSGDGTAQLWQVVTGKPLGQPLRHEAAVGAVAFSPNGRTVVTGSEDGMARLWRAETGAPIGLVLRHEAPVAAVAFNPDGEVVMTGSRDGTVQLWQVETGVPMGPPLRHKAAVGTVAFASDAQTVAIGSNDGVVQLWQVATGSPLGQPMRHDAAIGAVAFSPDGQIVVTGSGDSRVQLWQVKTGTPVGTPLNHAAPVAAVAFSPDGKMVVTGSRDGTAYVWQAKTGTLLSQPLRHEAPVAAVGFGPDGQSVVTGSRDGTARLWRVEAETSRNPLLRHAATVAAVGFSPDGQMLVTGSWDGTARLWRVETGTPVGQPLRHAATVEAVGFSPDGQMVVTGSVDRTARLWRVETGTPVGQPLRHAATVEAVGFNPDGQTLVTGAQDGTVRLWRVETGESIGQPLRHRFAVKAVAFSMDGRLMATGSADRTARLWQVKTGEPIGQPLHHEAPVWAVAFSPDGKAVATGSGYGTVRLWQVETGEPAGQLLHHAAPVLAVGFSQDGNTLLAATHRWVHLSFAEENIFKPKASRLLAGGWVGAYRFLDAAGNQVQVASLIAGNAVKIDTLPFNVPDAAPLQGEPETLLKEWQQKLALTFNEESKIVPMWSVGVTR